MNLIRKTKFAISMEESRFTLNGALLLMRPEGLTMVATDGHRLAFVQASQAESGQVDQQFRWLIDRGKRGGCLATDCLDKFL